MTNSNDRDRALAYGVMRRWRAAGGVVAAIAASTALAACGGSSSSSKTQASASGTNSKFVSCMKSHGVTVSGDFGGGGNRPTGTGTMTGGTPPTGTSTGGQMPTGTMTGGTPPTGTSTNPTGTRPSGGFGGGGGMFGGTRSAKEEAAFKACSKYMTKGSFAGGGHFGGGTGGGARASFSAATLKSFVACVRKNGYAAMPEASTSTTGSLFPKSIESNKKFQAASAKCSSILKPSGTGTETSTTSQS